MFILNSSMKTRLTIIPLLCCLMQMAISQPNSGFNESKSAYSYCNPIPGLMMRDPFILKVGEYWYRVNSEYPVFPITGVNPAAMRLYQSADLINWAIVTEIIRTDEAPEWAGSRWWAPEIFHNPNDGKFYFTVNCTFPEEIVAVEEDGLGEGKHGALLMVADAIEGPYQVLSPHAPFMYGNDIHLFCDDDGSTYAFRTGIDMARVDLPNARVISPITRILDEGAPENWDSGKGVGREGPGVIKVKGTYYLFYSSWGRGYEVGIATSKSIGGPWT